MFTFQLTCTNEEEVKNFISVNAIVMKPNESTSAMQTSVAKTHASSIFGAKAIVEIANQHDKHVETLSHLHSTSHSDMTHFHTYTYSCKLVEVLTDPHYASHYYMKSLWTYLHPH